MQGGAEWREQGGTPRALKWQARGQDGSGRTEPYPGGLRGHSPELESLRDVGTEPCTPMQACPCCCPGAVIRRLGWSQMSAPVSL